MNIGNNPFLAQETPAAESALLVATVLAQGEGGYRLKIDGQDTQMYYKALGGQTFAPNQRVLCGRVGGSYVILGGL